MHKLLYKTAAWFHGQRVRRILSYQLVSWRENWTLTDKLNFKFSAAEVEFTTATECNALYVALNVFYVGKESVKMQNITMSIEKDRLVQKTAVAGS